MQMRLKDFKNATLGSINKQAKI